MSKLLKAIGTAAQRNMLITHKYVKVVGCRLIDSLFASGENSVIGVPRKLTNKNKNERK